MSYWKLTVEQFGKIEHAEIELAPLTLFVGDNNSGKSYLLSLAWALRTIARDTVFSDAAIRELQSDAYGEIEQQLLRSLDAVELDGSVSFEISEILPQVQCVINELLEANKQAFVKALFNSDSVQVGNIALTMPDNLTGKIKIVRAREKVVIIYENSNVTFSNLWATQKKKNLFIRKKFLCRMFLFWLIAKTLNAAPGNARMIYLPAARTGFMLTKDIINKFARKKTYDVEIDMDDKMETQPFSRPIIEFLDVINELSEEPEGNKDYRDLVRFIQDKMVQGNIEIAFLAGKELSYIPYGQKEHYPFRTTSAVVTELSPLLLLLEHQKNMVGLFYEEPEMCLHPALQKRMGQVLIRLVNAGVDVTTTTHSDIILQHINNMIRLKSMNGNPNDYGYEEADLIIKDKIRVYQLLNRTDSITEVSELPCGDNGFAVPTFNDALDNIMDETIRLQS